MDTAIYKYLLDISTKVPLNSANPINARATAVGPLLDSHHQYHSRAMHFSFGIWKAAPIENQTPKTAQHWVQINVQ